ncbi:MAG: hypothetical protein QY312_04445 [Candidatus Dojkabacteria bacterium]|nr:MAG: hypothetical protein QY312_04445 [Candidatus Dojkabacteria bacterium]
MKGTRFGDPLVLATIAILFFIGVFVLYTTSPIGFASDDWLDSLVFRQLLFGIIAFIIIFVISFIDLQISKTFLIQIFLYWHNPFIACWTIFSRSIGEFNASVV